MTPGLLLLQLREVFDAAVPVQDRCTALVFRKWYSQSENARSEAMAQAEEHVKHRAREFFADLYQPGNRLGGQVGQESSGDKCRFLPYAVSFSPAAFRCIFDAFRCIPLCIAYFCMWQAAHTEAIM